MAVVLTAYAWIERLRGTNRLLNEAFENPNIDDAMIETLKQMNTPVPTEAEAVAAHQTLLRFMKNDFTKGIKFAEDFGKRFYGDSLPFRQDLDVRTLADNYRSPLQGI